ncbi:MULTISPECIES: primase-helicase zinc-binding domain-containing protein [unclassified Maridesulfovibrio]|uniref:primase-helicase zinc-binding domain-containing protein n=1 Tax=unclassified Maridesulfovibrio TaxID=2794999 RepID=UPI003B3F6FAC
MNVLDLLKAEGVSPVHVSGGKGGEFHSPCPACGGKDRFHVWPEQNGGTGSWWCRGCDKGGDNIEFLREFKGASFKDACDVIGRNPKDYTPRPTQLKKKNFAPNNYAAPKELWLERSNNLVDWAHEQLLKNEKELAYLAARGLPLEAVKKYKLGWNPGETEKGTFRARKAWGLPQAENRKPLWMPRGLVIPYFQEGVLFRVRFRRTNEDRKKFAPHLKYVILPGSSMGPMVTRKSARAWVPIEAELDALAVDFAVQDLDVGCLGLGSLSIKPDAYSWPKLKEAMTVLNALDFEFGNAQDDEERKKIEQQIRTKKWWQENLPNCRRWPVPEGKDPGEAFAAGVDLRSWIFAGLPPALTLGPSKSGAASTSRGEGRKKKEEPTPPPADMMMLYQLLVRNPLALELDDGIRIVEDPECWANQNERNWMAFCKVSDLVFKKSDGFDVVLDELNGLITAENILDPWVKRGWKPRRIN